MYNESNHKNRAIFQLLESEQFIALSEVLHKDSENHTYQKRFDSLGRWA